MTQDEKKEERFKLLCEKIVSESWSKVNKFTEEISEVLEKEELGERDISLLKLAAGAFLQKTVLEQADSISLFEIDLSHSNVPCGRNYNNCDYCEIEVCDYFNTE